MARELVGVFEVGGIEGKMPSEMTDEELDIWADALAGQLFTAVEESVPTEG